MIVPVSFIPMSDDDEFRKAFEVMPSMMRPGTMKSK